MILGMIADTHGLLRNEALRALAGSDHIVHAGDVGGAHVLDALREIAEVTAVRGNVDTADWARALPETVKISLSGSVIHLLHDVHELKQPAGGFDIVVSGHSHKHSHVERDGVHYINPGSAGPRRFRLPITVARLDLSKKPWRVDLVELG